LFYAGFFFLLKFLETLLSRSSMDGCLIIGTQYRLGFCWSVHPGLTLISASVVLGNSGTPCVDRGCTDNCSTEGKHTDTIVYVVQQIVYIHVRESILFRDKERIQ
jgi:hypothetical protein